MSDVGAVGIEPRRSGGGDHTRFAFGIGVVEVGIAQGLASVDNLGNFGDRLGCRHPPSEPDGPTDDVFVQRAGNFAEPVRDIANHPVGIGLPVEIAG